MAPGLTFQKGKMGTDPEVSPHIPQLKSLGEQGSKITRNPVVQWSDGICQVHRGRFAVLHRQQERRQESAGVTATFTTAPTQPLVQPRALCRRPISQSTIAASEAISTSTKSARSRCSH